MYCVEYRTKFSDKCEQAKDYGIRFVNRDQVIVDGRLMRSKSISVDVRKCVECGKTIKVTSYSATRFCKKCNSLNGNKPKSVRRIDKIIKADDPIDVKVMGKTRKIFKSIQCGECGVSFSSFRSANTNNETTHFCSIECKESSQKRYHDSKPWPIDFYHCEQCGRTHCKSPKRKSDEYLYPCQLMQRLETRRRSRLISNIAQKMGYKSHGHRRDKHLESGLKYDYTITAKAVAERFDYTCQICYEPVVRWDSQWGYNPKQATAGHIVALADGGDYTWDNVQCECIQCNSL